jgi:hypothetical protein
MKRSIRRQVGGGMKKKVGKRGRKNEEDNRG